MTEITGRDWDHARFCDALDIEIARFSAAVEDADPGDPVPTCPGWSVTDLILHLGTVHRWAENLVRTLSPRYISQRETIGAYDPSGARDWFAEGGRRLVGTLRAAGPESAVWTWGVDPTVLFWSRRMLHETAVHRGDAEFAVGLPPALEPDVATDGIDELLEILPRAVVFAPGVANLKGTGETISLEAVDTGVHWRILLEPGGFSWGRDKAEGTAVVRARAADLDFFMWGRRKLGDPLVEIDGDQALLVGWIEYSAF